MKLSNEVTRGARDITLASRIFLVVAVVSLVLSALLLAHNQGVFTRTIRAYFYATSAEGLNKGMAVKLIGFRASLLFKAPRASSGERPLHGLDGIVGAALLR